uniref:Tafazzin family protein n=1 Tax=Kalanchoe fedtschenkoi TaxID=63787 RepID=A0A7N0UZF1_KALFE
MDADNIPVVIPFVHTGMQEIMPVGAKVPRIGKEVTVLVGQPIHFDDLLQEENIRDVPRGKLYDAISLRIGQRLQELKAQVERIALEQNFAASRVYSLPEADRMVAILHQVDWESFGMESFMVSGNTSDQRREWHLQQSDLPQPAEPINRAADDRLFRTGFSHDGGIMSRIRRYVNPTELMGFAARGLFINSEGTQSRTQVHIVQPLRAWKQYLAASLQQQWNAC